MYLFNSEELSSIETSDAAFAASQAALPASASAAEASMSISIDSVSSLKKEIAPSLTALQLNLEQLNREIQSNRVIGVLFSAVIKLQ